jgi:hypothetical protein
LIFLKKLENNKMEIDYSFKMKNNILNGIIAPILSLMGALLCLIVAIILFDYHHRGGFHEKMYTFYRVSAIANAIFLFGNIQYLILSAFFKEDDENIGRFVIFYMILLTLYHI